MRTLLTCFFLLAAAVPALSQAQTVNICDRTKQVRDQILLWLGANDCAAVDSQALAGQLSALQLQRQELTALQSGDFAGLTGVLSLQLHENQLTALPADVFDGLTSLNGLSLDKNQLTALPADVFDSLTLTLYTLGLTENRLTTLPADVFDGLTRLDWLRLNENRLTALPAGVFDGLTSLNGLWLHDNRLATLPAGVFDDLTDELERLHLNGNRLTTLPAGVFDGLWRLDWLDLQDNRLTTLPAGIFDGLHLRRALDLSGNGFTTLSAGVFDGLRASVILDSNQLTTLPAGVFDGLIAGFLTLADNQLTTLPAGVFDGLSATSLNLADNQLTALPADVFDGLTSLNGLSLADNQLTTLPAGVFDGLTRLRNLDLRRNHLVGLTRNDPVFAGLSSEVVIRLEGQIDPNDLAVCDRTPQVRDAILTALEADDCAAVDSGLASIGFLDLASKQLTALRSGDFDGLTSLARLRLDSNQLTTLPAGVFDGLTRLGRLWLHDNQLTTLPAGVFDGLTELRHLDLRRNHLMDLHRADRMFDSLYLSPLLDGQTPSPGYRNFCDRTPQVRDAIWQALEEAGVSRRAWGPACAGSYSDGMAGIARLNFWNDGLRTLRAEDFAGLTGLQELLLNVNQLASLPAGVFDGLTGLQVLDLAQNRLTTLPAGVFDGLTSLHTLDLGHNQLTALPAGVFDGLTSLQELYLHENQLTALPAGVFDGLTSLRSLLLFGSQLAALPDGVFDGLTNLQTLSLRGNWLTTLADDVFDDLASLQSLDLRDNRLTGLTRNDPLFAGFSGEVDIQLGGQAGTNRGAGGASQPGVRLAAAVPLMLSASDATRQGFVRIVNESRESGSVRVSAFDDGGYAPDPIEIRLGAGQTVQFNSNDLENGNANKGVEGVGTPVQGDWRLDVETVLAVRVLSFVRHGDGFPTAMHDVLSRGADGRLVAHTFNPGRNRNQASRLRLVNTGENAARVRVEGVDDQGGDAGPVTLTLAAGESRTLSAFDLENGAQGLTGALGGGAGKWRLFIDAGDSVVGMSLLESVSGHLTNMSSDGVATSDE